MIFDAYTNRRSELVNLCGGDGKEADFEAFTKANLDYIKARVAENLVRVFIFMLLLLLLYFVNNVF